MKRAELSGLQLSGLQRRLSRWREQHGGRGRPIPEELWNAAVEVAGIEGVGATARGLGLNRQRLARRVEGGRVGSVVGAEPAASSSADFVEVNAGSVFSRGPVIVRLTGRDGEQLEIALDGGVSAAEVTAVARALWSRSR